MNEAKKDILNTLNPFCIKARYPTYKKGLSEGLSQEYVRSLIVKTGDFIKWLELKMK